MIKYVFEVTVVVLLATAVILGVINSCNCKCSCSKDSCCAKQLCK